ncbi:PA14 domain-containing protein [Hymenobacter sp.]|uniref:PA14 domain-containing protein n=1 Tax=Hymenobacter sp. TaxID=1898978 RepID=UPI00286A17B6|nr:PA14 domain-containing protein [Hymenobacter sp.]
MKKLFLTGLLAAGVLHGAHATNYYVASGANAPVAGVDRTTNGQGLSAALPFATIQYAADKTLPGDTVFVRAGTYTNRYTAVAYISRSGTPAKWITYRNYRNEKPFLQFNSWQGFQVWKGASYIEINGFRIQGNNRNVTLADALNQPGGCAQNGVGSSEAKYSGGGIVVEGRNTTVRSHHVRILNNEIFDCGAVGIAGMEADYLTIENNLVYDNASRSRFGGSGISLLNSRNYDNNTSGYRMIIRNNRIFGNRLEVPWYSNKCQGITDGNGIILDLNRNPGQTFEAFTGRFLVANNLIVNNGGAGVQVYQTDNVDVINNTCYRNARSPELNVLKSAQSYNIRGEVLLNQVDKIRVQNNIFVTDELSKVSTGTAPILTYTHNLHFGGILTPIAGASTITADPQFVNATTDWRTADFRLKATSPAINQGLNSQLSATDLVGNPRVVGPNPDRGAYESPVVPPVVTLRTPENPTGTRAGLDYAYYQGSWSALPAFAALTPTSTGTSTGFDLTPAAQPDNFGFRYTGYVTVPTDGIYTFSTTSDDGSQLFIGTTLVADNDGLHSAAEKAGTIALKAGTHALTVTYFDRTGDNVLAVSYQGPGLAKQLIPAAALSRPQPLRTPENPAGLVPGLNYAYYQGSWSALQDPATLTTVKTGAVSSFDLTPATQADNFGFHFYGYVTVPTDGQYTFFTTSDDGSQLRIGNGLVVDNDSLHSARERSGTVGLKAGTHFIAVDYFDRTGGNVLSVSYQGPGIAKQAIPASAFSRRDYSAAASARAATAAPAAQLAAPPSSLTASLSAFPNPSPDGRPTLALDAKADQTAQVLVRGDRGQLVGLFGVRLRAGRTELPLPAPLAPGTYHLRATVDGQVQTFTLQVR